MKEGIVMPSIVKDILTDNNFIGAIISALGFILIGFLLRKNNIITNEGKNVLKHIVLKIALPMMAFSAFMTDFSVEEFKSNMGIFAFSLVITETCSFTFSSTKSSSSILVIVIESVVPISLDIFLPAKAKA
jgi:predicted permease